MVLKNILDIVKYKNKDLLLAYVRKHYNTGNPIYYEEIQRELGFSIDYLCQILKPLKKNNIIHVKTIKRGKIQGPRKEIHLTEFGKWVVDNLMQLWLTGNESSWLLIESSKNREEEKILENSFGNIDSLLISSREDICRIIKNHISSFITPNILSKVLVNDIATEIQEYLLTKVNTIKAIRLRGKKQAAMS